LREAAGRRESFAGELENDWRAEIECRQAVDEQWIVPVGGLPNDWPDDSTQLLGDALFFHVWGKARVVTGLAGLGLGSLVKAFARKICKRRAARVQRRLK